MTDNERVAVLETHYKHLTEQLNDTNDKLDETNRKMDEMIALFNQAKGARWMIVSAATLAGIATAFMTKVVLVATGILPK